MRTPGNEFGNRQRVDVIHELLDDEIVRHTEVGGCESPFGKSEIDSVHAEGDLIFQFARVGALEAWTVADDECAFALVNILQRSEAADALPSPRVKVRGGQLRQTAERIVRVPRKLPERMRKDSFESGYH